MAVVTYTASQGLPVLGGQSVLTARNGSIWADTSDGLTRWTHGQIAIFHGPNSRAAPQRAARDVTAEGLPNGGLFSLSQDRAGRIWIAGSRGVGYLENDRFVSIDGVPDGLVYSMAEDKEGDLWIANLDRGLLQLRGDHMVEQIPWARLGNQGHAMALAADPLQGGLWLGFFEGGVAYWKEGQVRASYAAASGLGSGAVSDLRIDPDGTLWAATEGGLSRLKNGRFVTLGSRNGLRCNAVNWAMQDLDHSLWLYTVCGLARIARSELKAWEADPDRTIQATVFDESDGVSSRATGRTMNPNVGKSPDGKICFTTFNGLSVVDPHHIPFNKLPPPVHIEQIKVDSKTYDASSNRRLPALTRDLEIDYTGLSLVAPEKNRFKYQLEGYDRDWIDAGNRRQAFYTNLSPQNYKFRVIASNSNGVWNETGDTLEFSIAPAYYQTASFRAASVAATLLMLWALYRSRLHRMAREFNARLEGRVDERRRVARDLHDTLLQSFQGLLLQFQAARNMLRGRADDAGQVLDGALDDAANAITEARDTVQNMRSSTVITNELAKAVEVLAGELAGQQREAHGDAAAFSIEVGAAVQGLHPIVRDEVFRMTGEALRNAFQHARARRIEVEIRYDARKLRVRVRDDGVGIDAKVIEEGRTGHWGLPGMRERAKDIGNQLEVWSEQGAGTEVELTVPASAAYGTQGGRRFRLFMSKAGAN